MLQLFARVVTVLLFVAGCVTSDSISGEGGAGGVGAAGEGGFFPDAGGDFGGEGEGGETIDGPPICGDTVCAIGETCDSCPEDCPCEGPACGDLVCDPDETCADCEEDCGVCAACGDDLCDAPEDCDSCFEDCGVCSCVPDPLEPNAGSGTASPAQLGVDYCDLSVCAGDFDWLEFEIVSGFTATIEFNQAEGDLDLEIYSGITGQYVNGSYSADDDETVTLSGLPAGTYWARVYGDGTMVENPDYCFRVD